MNSVSSQAGLSGKWTNRLFQACLGFLLLGLVACSSTPEKPKPTALADFNAKVSPQKIWSVQLSPFSANLSHNLSAGQLALVTSSGLVSLLNPANGAETWRIALNTPIAAGIGGGSADAAAALRLAAKIWQLGPDTIGPEAIAPAIGADVPACLHAQSCYGSGVGDALTNAPDLGLKGQPILLVNPNVACPTGPVFAAWDGVDRGPLFLKDWQLGRNDLEQPAIGLVPVITDVLALLGKQPGVDLVRMSGSGATCFALFSDAQKRDAAAKAIAAARPSWWTLATRLR